VGGLGGRFFDVLEELDLELMIELVMLVDKVCEDVCGWRGGGRI